VVCVKVYSFVSLVGCFISKLVLVYLLNLMFIMSNSNHKGAITIMIQLVTHIDSQNNNGIQV
jgi:hypothetical protein